MSTPTDPTTDRDVLVPTTGLTMRDLALAFSGKTGGRQCKRLVSVSWNRPDSRARSMRRPLAERCIPVV